MQNKSDVKIMLKEAAILFAITLIAGLALGFVNELTKGRIAEQEEKAKTDACREVFADASSFNEKEYTVSDSLAASLQENGIKIGTVYEALDNAGSVLGYVVESSSSEGYGGTIDLYLGIRGDGTLNGISILEISETVGLGMRAEEVLVPQFAEKKVSVFTYTKTGSTSESEIDAISGATITTKAVTNAVNSGMKAFEELLKGGSADE
jgi:electron transport complex protein RnfG